MLTAMMVLGALSASTPADQPYAIRVVLSGKSEVQVRAEIGRAAREVCYHSYAVPDAPRWACARVLTRRTLEQLAARRVAVPAAAK